MGADQFMEVSHGKTANDAFLVARDGALYMHGHGGYTGTIAEKPGFRLFNVPRELDPHRLMRWVESISWDDLDEEIPDQYKNLVQQMAEVSDDKWGPAVGFEVHPDWYDSKDEGGWSTISAPPEGMKAFIFFGWASS